MGSLPRTFVLMETNHLDKDVNETMTFSDSKQLLRCTKTWFQKCKQKTEPN